MRVYMFDVDGVVVGLDGHPHGQVLERICEKAKDHAVVFIGGREMSFLREKILPTVQLMVGDIPTVAQRVLMGAEYGSILSSGRDGWVEEILPWHEPVPPRLRVEIRRVVGRYPLLMSYDRKRIIATAGIRPRSMNKRRETDSLAQLEEAAAELVALATGYSNVEISRTTNAVDLLPKGLTKAFGANAMLGHYGFVPEFAHLFGDARADLLMAVPFKNLNIPYCFYFVGRQADLLDEDRAQYNLVFPAEDALYQHGTLEILESLRRG